MKVKTYTLQQYRDAIAKQEVSRNEFYAFSCPMCGKVQCAQDLIHAGAGKDFKTVEGYLAFSCVGRWTGAGSSRKIKDKLGCNWTLGGFLRIADTEIVMPDGSKEYRFRPTSSKIAKSHERQLRKEYSLY